MPKLYSTRQLLKVLELFGFSFKSQSGSHIKYFKDDKTVIIPANKKQIPTGTYKSIQKQSGIKQTQFEDILG